METLTLEEKYRQNEYWELSGLSPEECPIPHPELMHAHEWTRNHYCSICGADGAA